jgi:hypothetical protein
MADAAQPAMRLRLLVVGIDLLAVLVVIPLLAVIPITFGAAFLIRLVDHNCAPQCDGLALIGISIWFLFVMVFGSSTGPFLRFGAARPSGAASSGSVTEAPACVAI